ncbi:MAG: FG-GAP repeat protein, partial [Myxococcales bacterium]|nr:FG-GAP repeat protein [Myxococcales bacterium]
MASDLDVTDTSADSTSDGPIVPTPDEPYVDTTWQLRESLPTYTHGAALFREVHAESGPADVLIRVYGFRSGTTIIEAQPTFAAAQPGGTFQNMPDRLPDLPGFYSDLVTGDMNGDGCQDLVLVGFIDQDANPPNPSYPFKGTQATYLEQSIDAAGGCLLDFNGYTSTLFSAPRITRGMEAADLDLDGDLDLVAPAVHYTPISGAPSGGHAAPSLLLGDGNGSFVEQLGTIPDDAEMDGYALTPCDIDSDGDLDLIEAGRRRIGLSPAVKRPRVLVNQLMETSTLTFVDADPVQWGMPESYRTVSVTCADLDGDTEIDDLLLAHQQGEKTHLLLSDGSTFQDASILLPNLPGNGGVDYLYGPEQTQNVSVCALEDDFTGYMTLFFA